MTTLSVSGGGHQYGYRKIFHEVELELTSGDVLAITGANGSGKSTLLKILAGVLQPSYGSVKLTISQKTIPRDQYPLYVGLVAPYVNLYEDLTLTENLEFIAKVRSVKIDDDRIQSIVSRIGLESDMDSFVRTYSTGMHQRARLVAALYHEPKVILMDEPTLGLDREGRDIVRGIVNQMQTSGHVTVIASNLEDDIDLAHQSICIEDFGPNSI
ncbi:MAG: ABC transporter ATP-binding protein [Bacteroidetes bacterium]|nr:ABC transporter ATP-binding protein [Bacteroidota bacterium]